MRGFWLWFFLGNNVAWFVLLIVRYSAMMKRVRGDKDYIVRKHADEIAYFAGQEKRLLDRLKAVLNDLKNSAEENDGAVKDAEDKWQPQIAEHHRGKAAACRQLLARHRG
jgi:hypothetical protein